MIITADTAVRDIVVEQPATIPVLEKLGIDYCCGGKHTLADACTKRSHDVRAVLEQLQRQPAGGTSEAAWQTAPLGDLIQHIVQQHHVFARRHLDLIRELAGKVERRHGESHPEIHKVCEALATITAELTHHFSCEENMLFPHIVRLEGGQKASEKAVFANIEQPVARMMMDHDQTGDELRVLREATNNYRPPSDACTTYRALYRALEELERDLHQHIHLENNILFPRAIKLESEVPHGVPNIAAARG